MLLYNRHSVRAQIGRKRMLGMREALTQKVALSLPLLTFLGVLGWRGLSQWPHPTGVRAKIANDG